MNDLLNSNQENISTSPVKLSSHHLLSIEGMDKKEIQNLIERANFLQTWTNIVILSSSTGMLF